MNVVTNRFTGKQKLEYWNNSPDTLNKGLLPSLLECLSANSMMMDTRSRRQGQLSGSRGGRLGPAGKDRILNLKPDEIGYQKVLSLKMNGRPQKYETLETILEVWLDKPIPPVRRWCLIWISKPRC